MNAVDGAEPLTGTEPDYRHWMTRPAAGRADAFWTRMHSAPDRDVSHPDEYRVIWSEEDGEYVGLCAEFPSLSWLAPSQAEALSGIVAVADQVCRDM